MKKIILAQPIINLKESSKYIKKVLEKNFPNEGDQTRLFEKKICNFLKIKYAVCVTSGTTAIFLALKACGIKVGDEVILENIRISICLKSEVSRADTTRAVNGNRQFNYFCFCNLRKV